MRQRKDRSSAADSMNYDGFVYMFDPASMNCWLVKSDESHPVTQLSYSRQTTGLWTYTVEGTVLPVAEVDDKVIAFLENSYRRFIGDLVLSSGAH